YPHRVVAVRVQQFDGLPSDDRLRTGSLARLRIVGASTTLPSARAEGAVWARSNLTTQSPFEVDRVRDHQQSFAVGDGRHRGTDGSSRWVGIGDEDVGGASGPPVPKGQQCPTVGCAPAPL